jgi:hypothetical protein
VLVAIAVGLVLIFVGGPGRRLDHVEAAIARAIDPPQNLCVSVSYDNESLKQLRVRDERLSDLGRRAVASVGIFCNNLGPVSFYFRFAEKRRLQSAITADPRVKQDDLCVVGDQVFTGIDMSIDDDATPFQDTCAQLRGHALPLPPAS